MSDDPADPNGPGQKAQVLPFARKNSSCPVCGQPSAKSHRPFCSERCADVDLGRWLKGSYRIPGSPADPDEPAEEAAEAGDGDDTR